MNENKDVFADGQWWLAELDQMVANGTHDQKRAVAVVRNLVRQHNVAPAPVAQAGKVATIQMRCRDGAWREVRPTRTEPTPELRADYLMRTHPGIYEVRRLYTAAPAPVALTPAQQHADELLKALDSAEISLSDYKSGLHFGSFDDVWLSNIRSVLAKVRATSQEGGAA